MMKNILLVDDDDTIGEELRNILVDEQYTVELVTDGMQALAQLARRRFDLVLLDLKIPGLGPGLGGLIVLKDIKHSWPDTKVLVVSGRPISGQLLNREVFSDSAQDEADERILRLADGFVSKPFDVVQFLERIRQVLSA